MPQAVAFKQVSKRFALCRDRPLSLQEFVTGLATGRRRAVEDFWALRDVDFEVQAGETFAIIGPNGAGKSTALGLMAGTIHPTTGQVLVEGRISPLLELGAGFHPDLTGRENVYLNATLFGLSRKQTDASLQDIIGFSELDDFIDVPLKHYSAGMYMRLGFAIAMNVNPDVLLIDEVLAVGDEAFQRKCLAKIGEFQREGRTIIFVSHSLRTVQDLCNRALWLDHGRVRAMGPTSEVVDGYLHSVESGA